MVDVHRNTAGFSSAIVAYTYSKNLLEDLKGGSNSPKQSTALGSRDSMPRDDAQVGPTKRNNQPMDNWRPSTQHTLRTCARRRCMTAHGRYQRRSSATICDTGSRQNSQRLEAG